MAVLCRSEPIKNFIRKTAVDTKAAICSRDAIKNNKNNHQSMGLNSWEIEENNCGKFKMQINSIMQAN
ncbi:hypothetical protein AOC28_03205 [Polynucleobacter sp. MWH-Adler-W8]|nr:hypothetical protein AOC28_03205 [Polynucleobacter sp. MWH-Adler-W8]